jgi:tetratricopeptide (TPR) repeat protein
MAYSGFTTPVIIENNSFTGTSTALFLSNIQGGAIKSNSFSGFGSSITALTSSLDVYDNTISSTGTYGIEALSGTELKMSYAGGYLVGGKNNITNSDSSSYNIYLEDSYFLMNEGENIFDVGYNGYHLYGWFPDSYDGNYNETENCFKVAGSVVDPPEHYVTLGEQGNQITDFEFTPYLTGCTQEGGEDMMVINLGDGIYDTVETIGQGQGGSPVGQRHAFDSRRHACDLQFQILILSPKTIYDSISITMRFRNYANVKSLCLQLLNSYPDSMQSLGALSKLYLAVSKTDTTTQGLTDLKTFYENLILNHQSNISLVKRCNYYVQKCKVLLKQYSSALSGFQQIINQNPASYEGLVARWDYMATSLLMQGQGGSERETSNVKRQMWSIIQSDKFNEFDKSDKFGDDDKSPFTREERKQIKSAVNSALDISYTKEKKREEILTDLSRKGDVTASRQLKVLKSLEQTVKTEKPKNISEHLKIVSGDIQKVFVNPNAGKNTNTVFIPQTFNLSQNYPNPFNPVTKISYDIPKNSMVKLIIYDILGREVKRLVNNEFKQPGRYIVEFNGTNLASGVYFYRLESGDFIQAKKMVLVK